MVVRLPVVQRLAVALPGRVGARRPPGVRRVVVVVVAARRRLAVVAVAA
jgi:hypothetical protein